MPGGIKDSIASKSSALGSILQDGPGFRFGSPEFAFTLQEQHGGRRVYVCEEHSLRVETEVAEVGTALVVSTSITNFGQQASPPIDVVEPLCLVFEQEIRDWRFIFANGGTTEHHYPPSAYRTHDWTRSGDKLEIESELVGGRSSNKHLPLLIALMGDEPGSSGFFCGMEWSGLWYMRFEAADWQNQRTLAGRFTAGIKVKGMTLDPGETLKMPSVHIGLFTGDAADGTNALRRYLYEHVCAKYHGKPMLPWVSYDHWFGIENEFTIDTMKQLADRAAELGVEVFVVDAGWFPAGFPDGAGNWEDYDRNKLPDGLAPLRDYVKSLGMQLGLWFEPERGCDETILLEKHPNWFWTGTEKSWGTKRFNHIDLAKPEAQDYIIKVIGERIAELDLRWSRWDYNIDPLYFWNNFDPTLKIQFAYMGGLYRVLDTLLQKYPDWTIEGCASGGRRIDIGTMKRAHTFWFSDQTVDASICRYMQARANRFLPGHLCNSSVAVDKTWGPKVYDDTVILSRMLGKLAFDGRITDWSPETTARMRKFSDEFKSVRHLLVQDFYQLLSMPAAAEDWDAVQFVGYDGDDSVVYAFAGLGGGQTTIPLRGLQSGADYSVSRRPDGGSETVSGAQLMETGLHVDLGSEEGAMWRVRRAGNGK